MLECNHSAVPLKLPAHHGPIAGSLWLFHFVFATMFEYFDVMFSQLVFVILFSFVILCEDGTRISPHCAF